MTLEEQMREFFKKGLKEQSEKTVSSRSATSEDSGLQEQTLKWLGGEQTAPEDTLRKGRTSGSSRPMKTGIGVRRSSGM